MKRILLLFTLVFSNAKSQELFLEFDIVTWEELKVLQKDYLQSAEDLSLDLNCPDNIEQITKNYNYFAHRNRNILGTSYDWREYINSDKKKCLIKITPLNPEYPNGEILDITSARTLLSAMKKTGFKERNLDKINYKDLAREIYLKNEKILKEHAKKYGGTTRISRYTRTIQPAKINITYKEYLKLHYPEFNTNIYRIMPDEAYYFLWFENSFSQEQKQELIDRVANPGFTESNLELLNKTWKLKSYQFYEQELIPVPENRKYHIYLNKDTLSMSGSVDCNNTRGSFSLEGYQLKLKLGISTAKGCITSKSAEQWLKRLAERNPSTPILASHKPLKPPLKMDKAKKTSSESIKIENNSPETTKYKKHEVSQLLGKVITYEINNGELTLITDSADKLIFQF